MRYAIPAAAVIGLFAIGAQAQTTAPASPSTNSPAMSAPPSTMAPSTMAPAPSASSANPGAAPALGASSQAAPHTNSTAPAAVSTTGAPSRTNAAPVPGANSYTESQARGHITDKGFTSVSGLKKDDKGIWRGTAMKDGKQVHVALDYQGNVVAQ